MTSNRLYTQPCQRQAQLSNNGNSTVCPVAMRYFASLIPTIIRDCVGTREGGLTNFEPVPAVCSTLGRAPCLGIPVLHIRSNASILFVGNQEITGVIHQRKDEVGASTVEREGNEDWNAFKHPLCSRRAKRRVNEKWRANGGGRGPRETPLFWAQICCKPTCAMFHFAIVNRYNCLTMKIGGPNDLFSKRIRLPLSIGQDQDL